LKNTGGWDSKEIGGVLFTSCFHLFDMVARSLCLWIMEFWSFVTMAAHVSVAPTKVFRDACTPHVI